MLSSLFRRRKNQTALLDEKTSAEMTRLEAHVDEFGRNEEKLFEAIERRCERERLRKESKDNNAAPRGVVVISLSDNAA